MIEESSIVNPETNLFPWLDEGLDEKSMVISHLLKLEGQVEELLEQSQLKDMIKSDSGEDQISQSRSIKPFEWTNDYHNIEDFMNLMSQSTFDIEDRLKSQEQVLNSSFTEL